jgi:outer membrane biosynthesis protein TonB
MLKRYYLLSKLEIIVIWAVVAHTFNSSTWEAEAGGFLSTRPQDSQGYTEKPCLEKPKTQNPKPKTQNPKTKTQNPKPKTQNPKPKTQNPKTKNQKPKTKNQKPNQTNKQKNVLYKSITFYTMEKKKHGNS